MFQYVFMFILQLQFIATLKEKHFMIMWFCCVLKQPGSTNEKYLQTYCFCFRKYSPFTVGELSKLKQAIQNSGNGTFLFIIYIHVNTKQEE